MNLNPFLHLAYRAMLPGS